MDAGTGNARADPNRLAVRATTKCEEPACPGRVEGFHSESNRWFRPPPHKKGPRFRRPTASPPPSSTINRSLTKKPPLSQGLFAEAEGFEPPVAFTTAVFKPPRAVLGVIRRRYVSG